MGYLVLHSGDRTKGPRAINDKIDVTDSATELAVVQDNKPTPIVAIGASAGGLEALEQFFRNVPDDSDVAYVVVQHLSSEHKSMMGELLARHCAIPVKTVTDGATPTPNTVWLVPPGQELVINNGQLCLSDRPPGFRLPIDSFLESVAQEQGDRCVSIILSGTGSDGSRGLGLIKEAGGFVIAQDPRTARFSGMPENAIATGLADIVLAPDKMPAQILRLFEGIPTAEDPVDELEDDNDNVGGSYKRIFELLRHTSGVDFSMYKHSTVARRVLRRMTLLHCTRIEDYVRLLNDTGSEREALFHELLIGVTQFFRDEDHFDILRARILRPLLNRDTQDDPVRIWVPGCSTGEEAYTYAMMILEESERRGIAPNVKIFASDIDQRALDIAGRGVYPENSVAELSPERLKKYFRPAEGGWQVMPAMRSMVLFAKHDITNDPPFTKLDLVSCRNLLIYLAPKQQKRLFTAFHMSLREGGGMLLGRSENIGADADHWARPHTDIPYFTPIGEGLRMEGLGNSTFGLSRSSERLPHEAARPERNTAVARAAAALVNGSDLAAVLVDDEFRILHVFGNASNYLHMPPGVPVFNILHLTEQPLSAILASGIPRVIRSGQSITYNDITPDDTTSPSHLRILPSPEKSPRPEALIVFDHNAGSLPDGGSSQEVHLDDDAAVYLTELQQELQYAREGHQALVEELASSNEELQAANEELLASNEELQATNEELQSVNEELHTLNNEYQRKISQLEELSADLDSLFEATDIGTLFLDDDLAIRRFTPSMTSLLPLVPHDLGRSVSHFAGLLGKGFLDELQEVMRDGHIRERTFHIKSAPILVRILRVSLKHTHGLIVTFIDVSVVERAFEVTRKVLNAIPAQVALLDKDGIISLTNAAWDTFAVENGGDPDRVGIGTNYLNVCDMDPDANEISIGIKGVLQGTRDSFSYEYPCHAPASPRWFLMDCIPSEDGAVVTHFNVTERKLAEMRLQGLATTDPLTSVLNRRGLDEVLAREMDKVRRLGVPLSVLMIDCDDFKTVNDQLGHAAGDVVLLNIVHKLKNELRSDDKLARVGGDEFVILLPETSSDEARKLAERLRLAVSAEPVALSDENLNLTISMAVAQADLGVQRAQDVLERCRDALTTSKKRGKNRVTFAASAGEQVHDVSSARHMLQRILTEDAALGVVGQPIVDLETRRMIGIELLSRSVYHPDVSPTTFFRAAKEEELLPALDRHCFGKCLRACADLPEDLVYAVNLYPSTLLGISVDDIPNLFGAASGRNVRLEISEQQIIGAPSYLLKHVKAARQAGIHIALDDVGFGRTSLEALILLEPETVKIDRSFIKGVTTSDSRQRWLERLVAVANSLGSDIVAEGVETREELEFVQSIGVPYVQGFYFRAPMTLPELVDIAGDTIVPASLGYTPR